MSVINTNYLALVSQNNLVKSQNALGQAIERLSSGLRINSAKDDAAGQAIANRFTANIRGLTQAARNANDGVSIAQTTEGALNEINNNLQRIRELTVQAANGSNSESDLKSIQDEITERLDEIDRVSRETQFNGKYILGDDAEELTVQVGAHDGESITVKLSRIDRSTLGLTGFNVDGSGRIANARATPANLTGATDTGDGTYTVETAHEKVAAADAFAQLSDGNTVTISDGVDAVVYTYNAADGNFTYDAGDTFSVGGQTQTDLDAIVDAIAAQIGTDTTITVEFEGTQTNIQVDADGKLTAENGDILYIDGGVLTSTPVNSVPQATLEDVIDLAAQTQDAKITRADGGEYVTTTAHENETSLGAGDGTPGVITLSATGTISKDALLGLVTDGTASSTQVQLGNAVVGGTIDLDADGVSTNAYKDATTGEFTTESKSEVVYGTDSDGNLTLNGQALYVDGQGKLTTEADRAGTRTENPLAALDEALQIVDNLRSHLGAIQNRFESTIANLNNTVNNLSAARSRIEDADYAVEVSNMTRAQILQQAGTSVLAQANQVPQTVLSLLR